MRAAVLVASLLLMAGLAGCFGGGDDVETEDEQTAQPVVSETTGAVHGKVLTVDLELITGASVNLVQGNELVQETTTNSKGEYALNNIEPGTYRVQVNAICCEGAVAGIEVKANEVTPKDFMLTMLEEFTFGRPYVFIDEFQGFISCTLIIGSTTIPACAPVSDGQHVVKTDVPVDAGLETVSVAMTWQSASLTTTGSEMGLTIRDETTNDEQFKELASLSGTNPIEWQKHNSDYPFEESFQGRHNNSWHISFAGKIVEDPAFVYQHPFTIYYAFHYWDPAPEGYSALPDV